MFYLECLTCERLITKFDQSGYMIKAYFNWSSGKDAAMALHLLQEDRHVQVDRLVTTINGHHNRVSMHGLQRALLEKQALNLGLPLTTIELPESPSMEEYNRKMSDTMSELTRAGYSHCGFGDIFLEDLKQYRETKLAEVGISGIFPLWKKDTRWLIEYFIDSGFKAVLVCGKSKLVPPSFSGREIDLDFLKDLPKNVDPCGENGEFHTFCYDGPIFKTPVQFIHGETITRTYENPELPTEELEFWFHDLIPK